MTDAATDRRPDWQGINHLALVTGDMDATTRFWHGVLGAEIVATVGTPQFRHYFFRVGDGQTVAFFEYHDTELETYAKPAGVPYPPASQFDHLSLGVEDEAELLALRDRIKRFGCEVTDVVDHGFIRSIYFSDPSGLALEASWWTEAATDGPPDHGDRSVFADPDPVPALREIIEHGAVVDTPRTTLVDDITVPAP
ncbi:MAG: VOC family protein [Actinomycetota bacterium]|nr:VOC family protein [Actinomycetota bacterium]